MVKLIDSHKDITNVRTAGKVMPYEISSNGSAGGCLPALCRPLAA